VCVAVCCIVLQRVAACCSVLQRVAVCCSVLQCVAVCCSALQCASVSKEWHRAVGKFAMSLLKKSLIVVGSFAKET